MHNFPLVLFVITVGQTPTTDSFDLLLNHLRSSSDYSSFVYPTFGASADLKKATTQFAQACPDDAFIYRSQDHKNNIIARVFDAARPVEQGCLELRLTEGSGGKIPLIEAASFQSIDIRLGMAKTLVEQLSTTGKLQPELIFDQEHGGTKKFLGKIGGLVKDRAALAGNEEGIVNQDEYSLTKNGVRVRFSSTDRKGPRPGLSFGLDIRFTRSGGKTLIDDIVVKR